jgi:phage terminase large subunit-like protein
MQMDKWAACGTKEPPDPTGRLVVAGIDLSATIDLTSVAFSMPLEEDRYYIRSHSFMPEETFLAKVKKDKVPYDLWVQQGWITLTPGAEVDYHLIFEYLVEEYDRNGWTKGEICFDRALATWLTGELSGEGFTPIEIPQSYTGLSAATKDFRGKVYQGKIIHDDNPVLTWAASNAVTRAGPSENIMLDKSRAKQRIDPIAAAINAHVRAMVKSVTVGVYATRGMRIL